MSDPPPHELNLELIQDLCLVAGRIMEDVSADLALNLPASPQLIAARVGQLHQAAEGIMALASAARTLVR